MVIFGYLCCSLAWCLKPGGFLSISIGSVLPQRARTLARAYILQIRTQGRHGGCVCFHSCCFLIFFFSVWSDDLVTTLHTWCVRVRARGREREGETGDLLAIKPRASQRLAARSPALGLRGTRLLVLLRGSRRVSRPNAGWCGLPEFLAVRTRAPASFAALSEVVPHPGRSARPARRPGGDYRGGARYSVRSLHRHLDWATATECFK